MLDRILHLVLFRIIKLLNHHVALLLNTNRYEYVGITYLLSTKVINLLFLFGNLFVTNANLQYSFLTGIKFAICIRPINM